MKSVAIVGWYHKLNYGDDLLQVAFCNLFSSCKLSFIDLDSDPQILKYFDYVIFGGGSIWPNKILFSDVILSGCIRYSVMGISVRELTARRVSHRIIENADLFMVRDLESKSFFGHPKVEYFPDLTWVVPLAEQAKLPNKIENVAINLRNWNRFDWNSGKLVSIIRNRSYTRLCGVSFFGGSNLLEDGSAITDREKLIKSGVNTVVEGRYYETLDTHLNIGMRFHFLVLSAQMGIPFIGFDYHPKIKAFMHDLDMADYCVDLSSPESLSHALAQLEENYLQVVDTLRQSRLEVLTKAAEYWPRCEALMGDMGQVGNGVKNEDFVRSSLLRLEDKLARKFRKVFRTLF